MAYGSNGDIGKFRLALERSGFGSLAWRFYGADQYATTIFNDRRNKKGTVQGPVARRLKLWLGTGVFEAPIVQQQELERNLKALFGKRYLTGYFIHLPQWIAHGGEGKSLCIKLSK